MVGYLFVYLFVCSISPTVMSRRFIQRHLSSLLARCAARSKASSWHRPRFAATSCSFCDIFRPVCFPKTNYTYKYYTCP